MNKRIIQFIPILLLLSAVFYGLGITLPMVQFDSLYFFSENPSLIELILGLWADGNRSIAFVVSLFSLLFPIIKLYTVFSAAYRENSIGIPAWAIQLARWSMMDVLIVALVIYSAKASGLATAAAQPGIWFYGFSTITISLAAYILQPNSTRK